MNSKKRPNKHTNGKKYEQTKSGGLITLLYLIRRDCRYRQSITAGVNSETVVPTKVIKLMSTWITQTQLKIAKTNCCTNKSDEAHEYLDNANLAKIAKRNCCTNKSDETREYLDNAKPSEI
jgi:hypothetical protein